jgi:hypothetical protein
VGRFLNEVTLAAMDAAENDEDIYGPFDSVGDLMETLDALIGIYSDSSPCCLQKNRLEKRNDIV